jgi:GTP-binding protein HflX
LTSAKIEHGDPVQTALVLHPDRARRDDLRSANARVDEAVGLAEALDLKVVQTLISPLRRPAPATLLGSGKVAEIAEI